MPWKTALAVTAVVALLVLVYFVYLGCEIGEWRTLLIENEHCRPPSQDGAASPR